MHWKNECLKFCPSRVLQGHTSDVCLAPSCLPLLSRLWWLSQRSKNHRRIICLCPFFWVVPSLQWPTNEVSLKWKQDCCGHHTSHRDPTPHWITGALEAPELLLPEGFLTHDRALLWRLPWPDQKKKKKKNLVWVGRNHKVGTAWFQCPLPWAGTTLHQTRLPKAPATLALNTSREEAATTSLGITSWRSPEAWRGFVSSLGNQHCTSAVLAVVRLLSSPCSPRTLCGGLSS